MAGFSRHLDRPVSVAVKGPSSSGKSELIKAAILDVQPDEAYIFHTGMSARSIVHNNRDYRHKMLLIPEASALDDEYLQYLLRTLLSENVIKYEVTEKVDGHFEAVEKVTEGPTGLIISTTRAKLHPENETRLLSIHTTDTRDQTKGIMDSIAEQRENRQQTPEMDTQPWKEYATWLAGQDNRVVIPYARALASLIQAYDVRQRRDITLLFNTIETLTIMHQVNRDRNRDGYLVATLRDYEMARDLLNDLLSQGIGATVSKNIRETVAAVKHLTANAEHTNNTALEKVMKVGKSALYDRVNNALASGYIVDLQEQGKRGKKLALGAALPDDVSLLPEAADLPFATVCNIFRSSGFVLGWKTTVENLPTLFRSLFREQNRNNEQSGVSEIPSNRSLHTEEAYIRGIEHHEDPQPAATGDAAPISEIQTGQPEYVTKSPESVTSSDGQEAAGLSSGITDRNKLQAEIENLYREYPFLTSTTDNTIYVLLKDAGKVRPGDESYDAVKEARRRLLEVATV
jgi:hypothetical protein